MFENLLPLLLCLGALVGGCDSRAEARESIQVGEGSEPSRRPNILLIFADDQRPDTIGAWGNPHIRTPHLDRLSEIGTSFRRAYNLGSRHGAVCQPSRAMLHTGIPYFGMDLDDFDGRETLGERLGKEGYRTFATGKWHNGRGAFQRSFQRGKSVFFGGMSNHNAVPLVDWDGDVLGDERVGARHSSELFADAAVSFLESVAGQEPFFCYVAFTAPHDPRDPPPKYREAYYSERPPLPKNFLPQHPFDNGFRMVRDEQLAAWPRQREVVADQLAEYYGLISHLDEQVGRVLGALDATGRRENTLIVYAADHGLAMGSHGLLGKQNLYEHSAGTPLVIAGPGVPRGVDRHELVYLLDLFPTLLSQAGAPVPEGLVGSDLEGLWAAGEVPWRTTLFTAMKDTTRAIRDERWKLIRYPQVDHLQLFDLEQDPDELHNLASVSDQAARIERMREELIAWQQRLGDEQPWTAQEVQPLAIDRSGAQRKSDRWQPEWIREKYFGE